MYGVMLAIALSAFAVMAEETKRIDIVYLGTDDCFYCQHWQAARKPELLAAIRGTRARLVEIHGETLSQPIIERHYPPDYRWLYREVGDLRGVPRFFLVVDGKIVLRVIGTNAYSQVFLPRLQQVLAASR